MIFHDKNVELEEIGSLKIYSAKEIKSSPVSIGFECLDREMFDPEKCYDLLAASGVKWARCQTGWSRCEKEKGKYDFTWLDTIIDSLSSRGIQPWFNVGFGNKLYMNNLYSDAAVGFVPLYYGDEALNAWKNYIKALARHYKGRVEYFEIWNESNISSFWRPKTADPLEYAKLIHITAKAIRSEIPDAKIGGCISGTMNEFILKLFHSKVLKDLNFFSIHPYCIQPELNYPEAVDFLRRTLDKNGGKHVELWQGESGYASWFHQGHWLPPYVLESERNQAVWMLRRYFIDVTVGMKKSSFFQMVDMMGKEYKMGDTTRKQPARHGILNGITYTPKLSYKTMTHLTALFQGDLKPEKLYMEPSLNRALPRNVRHSRLADAAIRTNSYVRNGFPIYSYHLAEDMQFDFEGIGDFSFTVENSPEWKPLKNPVLIDMLTGKVYRIKTWKKGKTLSYFNKLPLTDYPLLICDEKALAVVRN